MPEVRFTVPGAVRGKGRPRASVRGGRFATMYTDAQTRNYEATVALAAQAAMGVEGLLAPLDEAVAVSVRVRLCPPASAPKKRREAMLDGRIKPTTRPDADNVAKAITDGCNAIVYRDDCLIVGLTVWKEYAPTPGVDVRITTLNAA